MTHRIGVALALAALVSLPVAASEKTDVMGVLRRFNDSLNKGDRQATLAACSELTSALDDIPPHEWHGAGACTKWLDDLEASNKTLQVTGLHDELGKPRHINITGDRAYVVVPLDETYKMKGKQVVTSGNLWTVALQKGASGWQMTAWAFSDGIEKTSDAK
jgi:hypothetical protein